MLTPEQIKTIKQQILNHIEEGFPEDKKDFAKKQVEAMGSEQLEEFLKQNNLAFSQGQQKTTGSQKCVFCEIVLGGIPSYKIAENKESVAVLEINPLSKGHVIIIPKIHADFKGKVPQDAAKLAEKISKKIKSKLKPDNVTIKSSSMFGHEILNVIPLYKEDLDKSEKTERYHADEGELLALQKLLSVSEKPKSDKIQKPKITRIKKDDKIILPRRIP